MLFRFLEILARYDVPAAHDSLRLLAPRITHQRFGGTWKMSVGIRLTAGNFFRSVAGSQQIPRGEGDTLRFANRGTAMKNVLVAGFVVGTLIAPAAAAD